MAISAAPIGPDIAAPIQILSDAYGLPHDHKHGLATIAFDDCSLFEVDAFPAAVTGRPLSSIGLPCGIAMVSVFGTAPNAGASGKLVGAAGDMARIHRLVMR